MFKKRWFKKRNRYKTPRSRFMSGLIYYGAMVRDMIGVLIALATAAGLVIVADAIMNY